ncbi:hypothetical protein P691DRAFT_786902, partial [Macrolepiota fuliginosa MF-IS2]
VWRCYMVYKAWMGYPPSFWGLWVMSFGTNNPILTRCTELIDKGLQLQHRRMVRTWFGDDALTGRYHYNIVGILLESAAINVPIAICAVVGNIVTKDLESYTWQVVYSISIPSQAFTTVMVIHQVALGRAIGQQKREDSDWIGMKGAQRVEITDRLCTNRSASPISKRNAQHSRLYDIPILNYRSEATRSEKHFSTKLAATSVNQYGPTSPL